MSQCPTLSIVIPTRNCLAWLPQALGSITAPPGEQLEILVVEDGSTDGTGAWLARQSIPGLRVLVGPAQGVAAARNLALQVASAPLIAFLDADDVWHPGKLANQLRAHRQDPDLLFSFTDYHHVDEAGIGHGTAFDYWPAFQHRRGQTEFERLSDAAAAILAAPAVGTSTVMARRDALQSARGFAADLAIAEDWDLWLRLASLGPVAVSGMVGTTYLMRRGSTSRDPVLRQQCLARVVARHRRRVPAAAVRMATANLAEARSDWAISAGRRSAALIAAAEAWMLAPSWRRFKRAAALGLGGGQ